MKKQTEKLMPLSLVNEVEKLNRFLVPIEDCYNRFFDAMNICRDHKESFGFIPEEWAKFMIEVELNLKLGENPTKEVFMDKLIQLQARRLAWITRIVCTTDDYEQEDLLEMNIKELEDILNELFPSEPRMEVGSFARGFYTNSVKKAA